MTVLVTGGAGFIGSHVCKALRRAGLIPVVYDHFINGHEWAVKWGPFINGDIHDKQALDLAFKTHKPLGVIHLASHIDVRESALNPGKYYGNNLAGTLSLLETAVQHGVLTFVFSSSAAVYGIPSQVPISEDHPKAPINTYGRTKWMAEQMFADFFQAHGLASISLRYFNAAGADPEGELGEAHNPETHLIPLALFALLKKRPHLSVYGTDHPTFDGTPIRDYIHVSDLADAHVKALQYLFDHPSALALNLGTGSGHSVRQVLDTIEMITKNSIPLQITPRSPSDPPQLVADAQKARLLLNWTPQYSDLNTIIETAWEWHNK
jgi:UDP-glucose-4-epimerase GalE